MTNDETLLLGIYRSMAKDRQLYFLEMVESMAKREKASTETTPRKGLHLDK